MSIQSQINRLSANVSDAFAAIESKGVAVPTGSKSDDLANLISQISTGSGSAITITDTEDEHGGIIRTISAVSLAGDTVTSNALMSGYTAHNARGELIVGTATGGGGSATISSLSVTPSESAQTFNASNVDGYKPVTVSAISSTYVGSGVTTKAAATITPGTTDQTINSGTYLSGTQTISGDSNLVAENIKSGVPIFGVTGSYSGGNPTLKVGVLRPDAELVKTFSYDKYIVADEEVTWPGYTTTATVLLASSALSETYTMDYSTYNYYILERMLAYPTYSISTHGKGRCEYNIASYLYEIADIEPSSFITIDGNAKAYTSRTVSIPSSAFYREFYWSSSSAVSVQSTTAYGVYFTVAAPTVSSGVITFNAPAFGTRGHTTYFTSTYMGKVTDVRYQWVIELYRAPKNHYNLNGWGSSTQAAHIIDCVNNNNKKLI